jgi:hypothetical protein
MECPEMRIIWKARDKNGIDMLLCESNKYWLVLKSRDKGMMTTNPSLDDLEDLQKALTTEILKKKGKK